MAAKKKTRTKKATPRITSSAHALTEKEIEFSDALKQASEYIKSTKPIVEQYQSLDNVKSIATGLLYDMDNTIKGIDKLKKETYESLSTI